MTFFIEHAQMAWWSAAAYKHKNAENRYVHHWVFSPQNKGWFCSVHNWCNPFSEPEPCHGICVLFCVGRTFAIKLTWQALLSHCYTFSPTDLDLNSPNLLWGKHGHCFERIDSCKAALIPTRNQLPVSPYCTIPAHSLTGEVCLWFMKLIHLMVLIYPSTIF